VPQTCQKFKQRLLSKVNDLSYLQVSNGMVSMDLGFSQGCQNLKNIARIQAEAKHQHRGTWNNVFN
jgi:hypothetical protein